MNIKAIFDKAEDGKLSYENFIDLANEGKAKFVDLSEGNYVDKQKYTDDLKSRDTRITDLSETINNRETDLASLREQLEVAGTDATKLTELNDKFTELQKQYDRDTKAYAKQLKDQEYAFAVTEFANKQKFTSQAAKRDFISSMKSKNLQIENGTILGATDFVNAYSQENADAFVVEQPSQPEQDPKPHFADSTNAGNSGNPDVSTPFNFNFTGVRPHDSK
jgi:myosin heavy subunit